MNDYKHVLVAIDFSPSSTQILKKANSIAVRNHAKLSLLHVIEYLPPIDSVYEPIISNSWVIDEQIINEQAQQSLQSFAEQHQLTNEQLHTRLGTPKYEISEFVKDHKCDLVVMGSHGRHGINILLGSTANALLHEMPCDILAVKIAP